MPRRSSRTATSMSSIAKASPTCIEPGTTYRKVADNKLDAVIMASPAAVDGALFIRTDKALLRIQ